MRRSSLLPFLPVQVACATAHLCLADVHAPLQVTDSSDCDSPSESGTTKFLRVVAATYNSATEVDLHSAVRGVKIRITASDMRWIKVCAFLSLRGSMRGRSGGHGTGHAGDTAHAPCVQNCPHSRGRAGKRAATCVSCRVHPPDE